MYKRTPSNNSEQKLKVQFVCKPVDSITLYGSILFNEFLKVAMVENTDFRGKIMQKKSVFNELKSHGGPITSLYFYSRCFEWNYF